MYPNAPLVLATVEVRHPTAPPLTPTERTAIKDALAQWTPILRSTNQVSFEAVMSGSEVAPQPQVEEFPKYFSRDSMVAVTLRTGSTVVETTRYEGWVAFLRLVREALAARNTVAALDGVERVGLRFIDEIRVPGGAQADWSEWLDTSILAAGAFSKKVDMPVSQWQGAVLFGEQPGKALALRYGLREGVAVDSTPELRRSLPSESGAFMYLDMDSFWTPGDVTPEFDIDGVVQLCDRLHDPVRTLFESLVTDRLRNEVMRNA
jgi:uncharacterized protein (TIGR04255 family)